MLLPVFYFHATCGLQNGEPVLLSSKMKVSRSEYGILKKCILVLPYNLKNLLQAVVSAVPHA